MARHEPIASQTRFGLRPRCGAYLMLLTAETVSEPCPRPLPTPREIARELLRCTS